ncbi:hypothetical protein BDN67DRAFT_703018 [Paxillus ammoniavirescens]|nr:hypothetical protein BDN67DRAFT_703018 [Paxillus ammoniavirescens]
MRIIVLVYPAVSESLARPNRGFPYGGRTLPSSTCMQPFQYKWQLFEVVRDLPYHLVRWFPGLVANHMERRRQVVLQQCILHLPAMSFPLPP